MKISIIDMSGGVQVWRGKKNELEEGLIVGCLLTGSKQWMRNHKKIMNQMPILETHLSLHQCVLYGQLDVLGCCVYP
jgi:hypothetical protein